MLVADGAGVSRVHNSCTFSGGLTSQRIEAKYHISYCVNNNNLSKKSLVLYIFLPCAVRWYTALFRMYFVTGSLTQISFGRFLTAFWTI